MVSVMLYPCMFLYVLMLDLYMILPYVELVCHQYYVKTILLAVCMLVGMVV